MSQPRSARSSRRVVAPSPELLVAMSEEVSLVRGRELNASPRDSVLSTASAASAASPWVTRLHRNLSAASIGLPKRGFRGLVLRAAASVASRRGARRGDGPRRARGSRRPDDAGALFAGLRQQHRNDHRDRARYAPSLAVGTWGACVPALPFAPPWIRAASAPAQATRPSASPPSWPCGITVFSSLWAP